MSKDDLKDFENIIDPKDFSSIKFEFTDFKNITSGLSVDNIDKIEFIEFIENILTLDLPQKCGREGHLFSFAAKVIAPREDKPIKFDATFKLKESEPLDNGRMKATCELMQYEEKDWKRIVDLYTKRQEELTQFLLGARGISDIM